METLFEGWELFRNSMSFDTAFSGYSPWTVTVMMKLESSKDLECTTIPVEYA